MIKRKNKSFIGALVSLAVLVVLIVVTGVILAYLQKGNIKFYVMYGETKMIYKTENLELPKNQFLFFYCKDNISNAEQAKSFTVKVIPNETATDFDFKVNGQIYPFLSERDLTAGFNIKIYDGYFILILPADLTLNTILSKVYIGYTVTDVSNINIYEKDFFTLVITSFSGENVFISFH